MNSRKKDQNVKYNWRINIKTFRKKKLKLKNETEMRYFLFFLKCSEDKKNYNR